MQVVYRSLLAQAAIWILYFLRHFRSDKVYGIEKVLYFLYGGRIVEWYWEHYVANTESNVGAGFCGCR